MHLYQQLPILYLLMAVLGSPVKPEAADRRLRNCPHCDQHPDWRDIHHKRGSFTSARGHTQSGHRQGTARVFEEHLSIPKTVAVEKKAVPTGTIYILPSRTTTNGYQNGIILQTKLDTFGRVTSKPIFPNPFTEPATMLQPDTKDSVNLDPTKLGPNLTRPPVFRPSVLCETNKNYTARKAFLSLQRSSLAKPEHTISTANKSPKMGSQDIFAKPVDTKPPPSNISIRKDHPVPRRGIRAEGPLQTNKFYSNFFLGDQRGPTYTFPYSVAWAGGKGASSSWGMACSHIDESQRVFGDDKGSGASSFYLNPIGIQSMVISAKDLGNETTLSIDGLTAFSARVHLSKGTTAAPAISFPLVQGMAFVTAQFNGSVPLIQSGVFFKAMSRVTQGPKDHVTKYNFHLEDGTTWRVYAWRTKGDELDLKVINNGLAESQKPFCGIIQVCKDPLTKGSEALLDDGSGVYPVTVDLSGTASGTEGTYCFNFQKNGHQKGNIYMFALPHHVSSFNQETKKRIQEVQLPSTTKGRCSLVRGTEWQMIEPQMPIEMGFAPWHPEKGNMKDLSDDAKRTIRAAAEREISQNMAAQSNLDSMYFSGKVPKKDSNGFNSSASVANCIYRLLPNLLQSCS